MERGNTSQSAASGLRVDPAGTLRDQPARSEDLKRRLRRVEWIREIKALILTAPALLLLASAFVLPLLFFGYRAVDNSDIVDNLPRTVAAMPGWQNDAFPPEEVAQALVDDISALRGTPALAILARTLNYHRAGYRSLIQKTASSLQEAAGADARAKLIGLDERWADKEIWLLLRRESSRWTPLFVLAAVDLERKADSSIGMVEANRAVYQRVFARTLVASVAVAGICLVLGYASAFALVRLSNVLGRFVLLVVLVSLWTSLLVRTLAWIIILQRNGVLNAALMGVGLTDQPIQLIRTWFAVIIAMVHLLLPMMILPIASVMRAIPPSYVRAARSLGASPMQAFWSVYVPQTFPGVSVGVVLVATAALGFFITPELLGGPEHQMVSYFIAFFTNMSVNWGLAAALGAWLLLVTSALFAAVYFLIGRTRGAQ